MIEPILKMAVVRCLEKHCGKPDLLQFYRHKFLVKALAALLSGWVLFPPLAVPMCFSVVNSSFLLRNHLKSWFDGINLADRSIRFAINALDSVSIIGTFILWLQKLVLFLSAQKVIEADSR